MQMVMLTFLMLHCEWSRDCFLNKLVKNKSWNRLEMMDGRAKHANMQLGRMWGT